MVPTPRPVRTVICFLALVLLVPLSSCSVIKKMQQRGMPPPLLSGSPDSTAVVVVRCDAIFDPQYKNNDTINPGKLLFRALDKAANYPALCDVIGGRLFNEAGEVFKGRGHEQLLVFADLPPDRYRFERVMARYLMADSEIDVFYDCDPDEDMHCPDYLQMTFILPDTVDFWVTATAGEITYLGTVEVTETRKPPYPGGNEEVWDDRFGEYRAVITDRTHKRVGEDYAISIERDGELKALEHLEKDCRECLWRAKVAGQLAEISKELGK